MKILAMLIFSIFLLFAFDFIHLILGHLLVRFNWSHKIGLRFLAMSMFTRKKIVAAKCRLDCQTSNCRNWTCSNYHNRSGKD